MVAVDPAASGLGFGNDEAAVDELARANVEFANDVRVRPARAQRHQAAAILRAEAVGAVPNPALALGFAKGIDVNEGAPLRLAGGV